MYEEKNNNSHQTSQVLLSVLAVAILVVAVVGVSFAFFTYSRQGTTTNTINTGTLVFKYNEPNPGIKLENALPIADTVATGETYGTGAGQAFDFNVESTITGNVKINYEIAVENVSLSAVEGAGERKTLDSKYVKVLLKKSETNSNYTNTTDSATYFDELVNSTKDPSKTVGTLKTLHTDSFSVSGHHYYRFLMWMSDHYKEGEEEKETMMKPDMCTNLEYDKDVPEADHKVPCDDPVYGENAEEGQKKGTAKYSSEDKGTNGKTFAVKLHVYAVDAPST